MRIDLICCDFATSRLSAKCASEWHFASLSHLEAKKNGEAGSNCSKVGESGEFWMRKRRSDKRPLGKLLNGERETRSASVAAAVPILT